MYLHALHRASLRQVIFGECRGRKNKIIFFNDIIKIWKSWVVGGEKYKYFKNTTLLPPPNFVLPSSIMIQFGVLIEFDKFSSK